MSKLDAGVTVEKFPIGDKEIGGLKFRHARARHFFLIAWYLVLSVVGFDMFSKAETIEFPVIGRMPILLQTVAVGVVLILLGAIILSISALLGQNYTALLSTGILHSTGKIASLILWDDIEEMSTHGYGKQRKTSLRIKNAERDSNLRTMNKISGWDWNFTAKDFKCRTEFIETALHYFYHYPEKRAELETEQGLATLRNAVAQKWKNPQSNAPIPKP